MVSRSAEIIKLTFGVVLLLTSGCFWRSYGHQLATHTELLVEMARKGADLVGAGRLTAESLPELTYPYERALAYAVMAHARVASAAPASLGAFDALLARYREFIDTLDRVRRAERGEAATAALAGSLTAVEAAGKAVHDALRTERGG